MTLTQGERDLAVRALRYYIKAEHQAIQTEWLRVGGRRRGRSADAEAVETQCKQHIDAAWLLIRKLRPNFITETI